MSLSTLKTSSINVPTKQQIFSEWIKKKVSCLWESHLSWNDVGKLKVKAVRVRQRASLSHKVRHPPPLRFSSPKLSYTREFNSYVHTKTCTWSLIAAVFMTAKKIKRTQMFFNELKDKRTVVLLYNGNY